LSDLPQRKITHVALNNGIPDLDRAPDCRGLYVVFWWHAVPLGHVEIPARELPVPATRLADLAATSITEAVADRLWHCGFRAALPEAPRQASAGEVPDFEELVALERPLEALGERLSLETEESTSRTLSLVICTRDRPEPLERCLRSLEALSQRPDEVVVVDNAPSSDSTRTLVSGLPGIRYVLEPRPGLDVARNTAARESKGELVAFADDDVTLHPDCIARLRQAFRDPKVMVVTGLVLPAELDTEAQLQFENRHGFNRGYRAKLFDAAYFEATRRHGSPVWVIGAGACMAVRRQAFERVGDFDERLDVGAAGCSGDSEFFYRVLAEGWHCLYEPAAVVHHFHRRDANDLEKQLYQYMRGHVTALLIQFEKYRHWGNLTRALVRMPLYYAKRLLRPARGSSENEAALLAQEIRGFMGGLGFYLRHRKKREPGAERPQPS
jgi:GT2 family glycosyltransferase